jgi:hypothetical protein
LFVCAPVWEAIPLFLDAIGKSQHPGELCFSLSYLSWREPAGIGRWDLRKLGGDTLDRWKRDFRDWSERYARAVPAEAIVETATTGKLLGVNLNPDLDVRRLVGLMLSDEAIRSLPAKEVAGLLGGPWPGRRHSNETDKTAPKQEHMAVTFKHIRDAVFLIAFRRDADDAIRQMEAGLRRNGRVLGSLRGRYMGHPDVFDPAVLFEPWLSNDLARCIDQRISDKALDPVLRLKWLVIRDEFFPQENVWLYDSCVQRGRKRVEVDRDKIRVRRENRMLDEKGIREVLKNRGY